MESVPGWTWRVNKSKHCADLAAFMEARGKKHLSVDPGERDALRAYLEGCVS